MAAAQKVTFSPSESLGIRMAAAQPSASDGPAQSDDAGSNNWALAGRLTMTGAALVASDMHLNLRVPTVWYRARLRTAAGAAGPGVDLNGLTLPGTPLLVAGSNGYVAWGFTNSYGKWLDLQPVECLSVSDAELRTPDGVVALQVAREQIRVRGGESVVWPVKSAAMGLLLQA